ncbi:MFS transporter [Parasporobacterium paucivorans]|uniref:Sugar phosphate permease n=1 Tax=Parasporobacterium paucivorans DSM 15970 TaxID=1122934 RepID=A0A1M6JXL8_9FIRM|nr:MFS transporter [Parasporobacterium paucivorans]SHJ51460.1 Sugar phosphate permease [Parasporobacterium paucivorans DSM 15970]
MDMEEKKDNSIKVMVAAYGLAFGFSSMDRLLILMLFPFIIPYFDLNLTQAGWIASAMAVGYIICALIGGVLSDKFGRKKVILPSIILFSVGSALTGLVTGFAQLIGIRAIVGGGQGFLNSAAAAQISEEAPIEKRGLYSGIYFSLFALLGSFVAPIYATKVASIWGWQTACVLTIIPGIILALLIKFFIKESKRFIPKKASVASEGADSPKGSWALVLKNKNIVVIIILAVFGMIWLWCWLSFGTTFFVSKGYSSSAAGGLQSAMGIGGFIGMLIMPSFSDRIGRKKVLFLGSIIGAAGTLAIAMLPELPFSGIFLIFIVSSFAAWGMYPVFLSIAPTESIPMKYAATAIALVSSIGEIVGTVIAPPLLGSIGDNFGITAIVVTGGVALIIVAIVSLFLRETAPQVIARRHTDAA